VFRGVRCRFLNHWQRESGGLAGSGLRLPDDVASCEQQRNRTRLNRRRRLKAQSRNRARDASSRPSSSKGGHIFDHFVCGFSRRSFGFSSNGFSTGALRVLARGASVSLAVGFALAAGAASGTILTFSFKNASNSSLVLCLFVAF
jgi:hypothetical protein